MTTEKEINSYYDQTYHQYRSVWGLDSHLGIHYGYWVKGIFTLSAAVKRMNAELHSIAGFAPNAYILDMGCGIGGSSFYLAENHGLFCTGINLNKGQIDIAKKLTISKNLEEKVNFINENYLHSTLPSENFDGIWALETICHCPQKSDFISEAYRLLKPGAKMILAEYFINSPEYNKKNSIRKWLDRWAIPSLDSVSEFKSKLETQGFKILEDKDITKRIHKSSLFMFLTSFPGMITTEINQVFKDYGSYSRNHYKSAFWQFIALRKKYWCYHIMLVEKPILAK